LFYKPADATLFLCALILLTKSNENLIVNISKIINGVAIAMMIRLERINSPR